MRNPSRRNKNIGTAKQGHGQNNRMVIPSSWHDAKVFYERLEDYTIVTRNIQGHTFRFAVEATRASCIHSCTIEDLWNVLSFIPATDFGDLSLMVLRQPKRKEELLNPVWGRLIYSFEFEGMHEPAIILEAIDLEGEMKRPKRQSLEEQREFKRLQEDGHKFLEDKRFFTAKLHPDSARQTQLFRTLPHEFGHYVHYCQVVETEGEEGLDWNQRWEKYYAVPSEEKERFAHQYADKFNQQLRKKGLLPFPRILDEAQIQKDGLRLEDFKPTPSF